MSTLHIKGQVCQYVKCASMCILAQLTSIPFVGIPLPLNLYAITQQITVSNALQYQI